MQFVTADDTHLPELMSWFPDRHSCAIWGGPDFRFPFTATTFREDVRRHLPTYSGIGEQGELLAFGQYYLRAGRCHVAFLAVSPNQRGRGIGYILIRELSRVGRVALKVGECSLFVMPDNLPARRLYESMGFESMPYPDKDLPDLHGALYMVASKEHSDCWEQD